MTLFDFMTNISEGLRLQHDSEGWGMLSARLPKVNQPGICLRQWQ